MAIPSKEYWARRSAERMIDYTAEAEKTANKIGKAYLNAGKYLSDEAGKVVKSFGKAFDLSEAEALHLLKNPPGKSVVQQLKAAVSGISDPDKRKELEKMISSPAYAYRIGRLEQVEKNIRNSCAKLYNTELKADESFFRSLPITAYERTIFDAQKAIGISSSFAQFPESRINRILSTKWNGEHFSERVWGNTNALANDLKHDMLVGIMAGKSEVHMADDIMARMGGGAYAARRVVRTETNYIANQAELDGYKECGLEKYEFSAHLDSRTSEICADMDGKVFALKDAQAGTNLPPMHPFCRSSTIPVLPSEEELDRIIQQDGDAIGADVDFEEWKSHLVENEDGKLVYRVDNSEKSGIIKEKAAFSPVETATSQALRSKGIYYNEVKDRIDNWSEEEIIRAIAGGDMTTTGSCASVALAYAGQKQGWAVYDFRGGESMKFFSDKLNKVKMFKDLGAKTLVSDIASSSLSNGKRILKQLQDGKEYYLSVGQHAAIVRNNNGVLQFLELQDPRPDKNGWMNFNNIGTTLKDRFGCSYSSRVYPIAFATDISQLKGDDFRTVLGYINTDLHKQMKGVAGNVK